MRNSWRNPPHKVLAERPALVGVSAFDVAKGKHGIACD
jgi:hypothetical protein